VSRSTSDAIIIGTGQTGPSLAFRPAGAGMKVALVERHLVGGTCVNTGCTPTKTLIASAYAARIARRAAEYGVVIGGRYRYLWWVNYSSSHYYSDPALQVGPLDGIEKIRRHGRTWRDAAPHATTPARWMDRQNETNRLPRGPVTNAHRRFYIDGRYVRRS
jgi:choline dehydrogenase-like flavoprotein